MLNFFSFVLGKSSCLVYRESYLAVAFQCLLVLIRGCDSCKVYSVKGIADRVFCCWSLAKYHLPTTINNFSVFFESYFDFTQAMLSASGAMFK
jgi:hypothetical protein